MKRLLLALLLFALLASPAFAGEGIGQWSPPEKQLNAFEFCRSGGKGVGYDPTSGLYAQTCGNYNWHGDIAAGQATSSFYVNCTADGAPHASCLRSGETRLIGSLHRIGVAADYTMPGGEVLLPIFRAKQHGIYVDVGCGIKEDGATRAECPRPYLQEVRAKLGTANYAIAGPHTIRHTIQADRGVRIVGEGAPSVTYSTAGVPELHGVWLVGDRGLQRNESVSTGTDIEDGPTLNLEQPPAQMEIGGHRESNGYGFCDDTSSTNPDCNEEQLGSEFGAPQVFAFGARSTILSNLTGAAGGITACVNNTLGTGESDTTGTCPGDRRVKCWSAGATTLRSAGGCCWDLNASGTCTAADYDISGGVGCQGFTDALETDSITNGQNLALVFQLGNCMEGATGDNDCDGDMGEQSYLAAVRTGGFGAACSTTGETLTMSALRDSGIAGGTHPMPFPVYYRGGDGADNVYAYDVARWGQSWGGGFYKIGFMPADWFGRSTCTLGTEAACDSETSIHVGSGFGATVEDCVWYRAGFAGSGRTGFDGGSMSLDAQVRRLFYLEGRDAGGGHFDPSANWTISDSEFKDVDSAGTNLFSVYGQGVTFSNNRFRNLYVAAVIAATQPVTGGMTIVDNLFENIRGGASGIIALGAESGGSRSGVRIERNIFRQIVGGTPVRGDMAALGSSTILYSKNVTIRDNRFEGGDFCASCSNTPTAAIFVNNNDTSSVEETSGWVIENNHANLNANNACLVWFEDDGETGAPATHRPTNRVVGNTIRSAGTAQVVCVGDADTGAGDTSTDDVLQSERYLPYMENSTANGTRGFEFPYHAVASATVPDCDTLPGGYTVMIYDDSAANACNDAAVADGVLDGGGTVRTVCACDDTTNLWTVVD